jgi:hypothetical protein
MMAHEVGLGLETSHANKLYLGFLESEKTRDGASKVPYQNRRCHPQGVALARDPMFRGDDLSTTAWTRSFPQGGSEDYSYLRNQAVCV